MRIVRESAESVRIACGALLANKARGVLTTLGIIIGIVAVVTTMTAANGLANNFKESVSVIGTDVLYVSRMPWIIAGNFRQFRNRPNVSLKEAEKLERQLRTAIAINPTAHTSRSVKYRASIARDIDIIGTTDKHIVVSAALPELGRFMTEVEVHNRRPVAVIGSTIRERLFEHVDPLNKKMKIGHYTFRVVGVMEQQGSAGFFGGPDFDSQVYVPISTFTKSFGGTHRNIDIAVKAPADRSLEEYEFAVIGEMRKIRKLTPAEQENFSINTMDSLVAAFNSVMGVVVLIGFVITSISLLVGGIGVANIMFVSVTERTREIGIRKAIGARRRAILTQFLFESSSICVLGGMIGLLVAFGVTKIIDRLLLPASISPFIVVVALLVSLATGVVAGFIPALRAARLNPIEALRYE
jgi:putative ABC transport system permease protein